MTYEIMSFEDFVNQVIATLEASGVEYMIGGAVATWAWDEPRATLDLDLVVNIPLEAVRRLSKELEKRGMLVPDDIILDNILETQSDLSPSMQSTYIATTKRTCIQFEKVTNCVLQPLSGDRKSTWENLLAKFISTLQKISSSISSGITVSAGKQSISETSPASF